LSELTALRLTESGSALLDAPLEQILQENVQDNSDGSVRLSTVCNGRQPHGFAIQFSHVLIRGACFLKELSASLPSLSSFDWQPENKTQKKNGHQLNLQFHSPSNS
jgi:hypothetical protein